jgi:hypothetical protein
MNSIEDDFCEEPSQIEAESMVWSCLDESVYFHLGVDKQVILVVGIPKPEMVTNNVLWLGKLGNERSLQKRSINYVLNVGLDSGQLCA